MTYGLAQAIEEELRRSLLRLVYSAPRTRPAGSYRPRETVSGPGPAEGTPGGPDRFTRRRVTLAEVEALLADVRVRRAEDAELAGRDFSVLVATEARLLQQKARIIDSEKDDEIELSKSPRWLRIRSLLAKMLFAKDRELAAEVAAALDAEGLG